MIEWIGYIASIVIAVSMLMSSLLKLRWINLFGAALFSAYGFIIGAIPVGLLNGFIVAIDVYYLTKMYSKKEYFKVLEVRADNKYLLEFLNYYKEDILRYFPEFSYNPEMNKLSFFVLRNMSVAGIVLAREHSVDELIIGLDYTIPEYRDFKVGKYVYKENAKYFTNRGYKTLCSKLDNKTHINYLKKMGFKYNENSKMLKKELQ